MTMAYGAADEPGGIATIRRPYELGVTLFDTAELYGIGTGSNEQLLGRAVKDFRDEIVIATKFGFDTSDPQMVALDSRPEHIREVTENSLRYLGTNHIDRAVSAPRRSGRADRGRGRHRRRADRRGQGGTSGSARPAPT
ncbi:MAG TPA: aldo/keto reductase [Kribbella sp.]